MNEEQMKQLLKEMQANCVKGMMKGAIYEDEKAEQKAIAIDLALNLIETQKAELEPIKKLNIPVKTLVAEFERLEDLEDNTSMLKNELEKTKFHLQAEEQQREQDMKEIDELKGECVKKDKIIDLMIDEYEYNARINIKDFCNEKIRKDKCIQDCTNCIKEYFTKLVKEEK